MRRDQEGPHDDGPEPAEEEADGQTRDRGVAEDDIRRPLREQSAQRGEQESGTTSK